MFDVVWSGRRHVMMGASQIDAYGNQNFAAIGSDYAKPKAQLLGFRGAPGNTINDITSYWIPNHSKNVFVEQVDVVCGIGYDRRRRARTSGGALPRDPSRRHEPRACSTSRQRPPHAACARLHPGVTVDDVVEATGFELEIPEPSTRRRYPTTTSSG